MANEQDNVAQDRAAKAQKAHDRAVDGAKAMAEYEAERTAVDANTTRLRALRLEKEGLDAKAAAKADKALKAAKAAAPKPKPRSRTRVDTPA